MNTYLVIMYINKKGKSEKKEFIYKCTQEDLPKYWKQEVKIIESEEGVKVDSLDCFKHTLEVEL